MEDDFDGDNLISSLFSFVLFLNAPGFLNLLYRLNLMKFSEFSVFSGFSVFSELSEFSGFSGFSDFSEVSVLLSFV